MVSLLLKDFLNLNKNVLFLGEGNFSFSAGLVRALVSESEAEGGTVKHLDNLWTTCFVSDKSKEDLNEKNFSAGDLKRTNADYLRQQGCQIVEGVDAEKLTLDPRLTGLRFSRIIFMFPHVGGKMKIHRNRALLFNVISSCREMVTDDGEIVITLARGQGGTPAEAEARSPGDTWRLVDTCHEAGCVLTRVQDFCPHQHLGYSQVGYRGLFKKFNVDGALIHTMMKRDHRSVRSVMSLDEVEDNSLSKQEDFSELTSLYPPRHVHHLSLWLPDGILCLDERLILHVLELSGLRPLVTRCSTRELYTDPGSRRRSQSLEIEMCDLHRPLGHTRALHLLSNVLATSLEHCFGVTRR